MSRINRKLLKKAKKQLRSAAKSGDETAESILKRRQNRKTEIVDGVDTRKDTVTNVSWNFSSGDLVCFKNKKSGRYGCTPTDCYIVIGTCNTECINREEKNSRLEVVGPGGLIVVKAADVKKVS